MSIKDVLDEFGVDYREHGDHPHATEGWVNVNCPLCSPTGHFRLGFSLTSSGCACWSCGKQSAGEMLSLLIDKPVKVAWAMLLKGRQPAGGLTKKARGKLKLPSGCCELAKLGPHQRYLASRGFDWRELSGVYGIVGTTGISDRPWSLVFPITEDFETVSFFTRKLHDKGTRYLSAKPEDEAVSAKELLFGEDFAVNAVCVCEGAFDAIRVGPGAVATMGLSVSSSQVRRLTKYRRVVVCFDSDDDAQRRAEVLCGRVATFGIEVVNVRVSGKDACVSPESEITEIRGLLK
jgi:hypothetical protein